MFNIFLIVVLLSLSYIAYFIFPTISYLYSSSKEIKKIKGKYFSNESLCSGFLNDVLYDTDLDSCQISCYIYNTFQLISSQKSINCGILSHSITISGFMINAKSNTTIKQHSVVNKYHYVNKQSLKV